MILGERFKRWKDRLGDGAGAPSVRLAHLANAPASPERHETGSADGRPAQRRPAQDLQFMQVKKKVSSIHHSEIIIFIFEIFILTFAVVIFAPSPSHPRSNRTGRGGDRGISPCHFCCPVDSIANVHPSTKRPYYPPITVEWTHTCRWGVPDTPFPTRSITRPRHFAHKLNKNPRVSLITPVAAVRMCLDATGSMNWSRLSYLIWSAFDFDRIWNGAMQLELDNLHLGRSKTYFRPVSITLDKIKWPGIKRRNQLKNKIK